METAKKTLPPMVNIGVMTRKQMQAVVQPLVREPRVVVTSGELMVTVRTPKGTELISCARLDKGNWHMRAREGFVTVNIVPQAPVRVI